MKEIYLIKLGGSLITDKKSEGVARLEVLERLANEVQDLRRSSSAGWIVGHGSGSFGHFEAHRHQIHKGIESPEQLPGISATQARASTLHRMVVEALLGAGETPFSLAPSSSLVFSGGNAADLFVEPLLRSLDLDLLPVAYGDVVMDREQGCAICSTETLFVSLITALQEHGRRVAGVYWLGETEGVLDGDGVVIPEIELEGAETLLDRIEGASGRDVTGGMRHRLSTVLQLASVGVASWIGNGLHAGRLAAVVRGDAVPGTWVRP